MSVNAVRKEVLSSDKKHMLKGVVYIPEGQPKGLFHVVHGMTEYIDRYEYFMTNMAKAGYVCFGYDNLGHGFTAQADGLYGYFAKKNGWKMLAEDVKIFSDEMKKEYPNLPYYLLGHSMGSFIVRVATEYFVSPDKLIVMGTGAKNPLANIGLCIIGTVRFFNGGKKVSKFIQKMAFGTYENWLTKDIDQEHYGKPPKFESFLFTDSAMYDLVKLNKESNVNRWFKSMGKKGTPIGLFSGSEDVVGDYGKGVIKVFDSLIKYGAKAEIYLYETYKHEILNDSCRDNVRSDIIAFIEKR